MPRYKWPKFPLVEMLPYGMSCLASVFFHFMTVHFDTVLSLSCTTLTLGSVLFNTFQVRERAFRITMPVSLKQLETRNSQLPSAPKPGFLLRSERCFKMGIRHSNFEQSYLHANTSCCFCFFPSKKKRTACLKHSFEKQNPHCWIHFSFWTFVKYKG